MRNYGVFALALVALLAMAGLGVREARATVQPYVIGQLVAPDLNCLVRVSTNFGIPLPVILAILRTEGGRVGGESRNSNGSFDLGPMQVNDRVWVPVLARMTGGDEATARSVLRDHGCANILFGTWILRQHFERTGDLATAVGWYHSRTPVHMQRYQERFRRNLMDMMSVLRAAAEVR